jgi:hypothetical protein
VIHEGQRYVTRNMLVQYPGSINGQKEFYRNFNVVALRTQSL